MFALRDEVARLLGIEVPGVMPQYNIAPTEVVLGAIERNGIRELRDFRWGLVPSWAKDIKIGSRMINARSEGILDKPSFRTAFQKRRCVIPASGFFEWRHDTIEEAASPHAVREASPTLFEEHRIERPARRKPRIVKQPFFIGLKSHEPFAFAGLYEYWHSPEGEKVRSCTILTTHSNELIAPIHDRMPVILRRDDLETWLDCEHGGLEPALGLLHPFPASEMMAVQVSSAVNDPNNKSPDVVGGLG